MVDRLLGSPPLVEPVVFKEFGGLWGATKRHLIMWILRCGLVGIPHALSLDSGGGWSIDN